MLNLTIKQNGEWKYKIVDEVLVRLDPYEQDVLTIETVDNIVVVSHIQGETREVVYSVPIQEP